jgi:tetratricopeptide (TPR) repeat protein
VPEPSAPGEPSDDLFRPPQLHNPREARSEIEEDRLAASAWFLKGRLNFQREDLPGALRCYQRAYRYDPTAVSVLREIVPLAFELQRNAEAARYAVIMAEQAPRDPVLLRRLAQHLMDERDYDRALALYEKSMALRAGEKPDAREVLANMEIARLYFIKRRHDKAADCFEVVRDALADPEKFELSDKIHTALLGNPRVTYALIGESLLEAGRLEAANEMFEKAFSDEASQPLLAYHLARIDLKNERPQAALEQLEKYLAAKLSTAGAGPYALLDDILKALHPADEAKTKLRERLEELHREDAGNNALAYFLAGRYFIGDDLEKAATLYEAAVAAEPTISGFESLAEIYRTQDKPEKLLDVLGRALQETRALAAVGDEAEKLSADKKLIQRLLALARERQKAAGDAPQVDEALAVALLAVKAKMFDEAQEQFVIAAGGKDEERRPAVMESWGLEMFLAQQYDRAAAVFQQAIDDGIAPRFDADFHYYLAAALEFGGHTDKALAAARKSAELKPDSPRNAARYPWVLYHAKRYGEAEREYRQLLKKYDGNHDDEEVRDVVREARMLLSNIAVHLKRMPDAEQWLEEVLDEFPEEIGALNDLGYLWCDQNKHLSRSLVMVQAAVKGDPENAAYRDSLGWAYHRLGRHAEAVEHLEKAVEQMKDSPDGVLFDHLGDAYHAAGRKDDARKAWQQAIEQFKKDKEQEQLDKTRAKMESNKSE